MIVCHCTRISDRDIDAAISWMRGSDPHVIITPGRIYRALGKRPVCGGCLTVFLATMQNNDSLGVPATLRGLRRAPASKGQTNEGRSESHRISQPSAAQ